MAEMLGIDVSNWQAGISRIADLSPRPDFVICKATGGTGYVDPQCDRFIQECIALGIPWGFYHFADDGYGLDPIREAEFFVENTKNYFGHGLPILDWEPAASGRVDIAKAFLDRVQELTGHKPVIYMNASTENSHDWSSVVAGDYGLWLAGYPSGQQITGFRNSSQYSCPYQLKNWSFMTMWQYTSTGRLGGYGGNLDCNQFYGDASTWAAYVGATAPTQPTPAPAPAPTGNLEALADAVIRGDYGNGAERIRRLGANYQAVQDIINRRLYGSPAPRLDLNALADAVIRGDYGNGEERKRRLGANYQAVQDIVNKRLYG